MCAATRNPYAMPAPPCATEKSEIVLRIARSRSTSCGSSRPTWPPMRPSIVSPSQSMDPQPDGSLIVQFRAGGLLEMSWHLFTWGDEVEIVKPRRLASLLEKQCEARLGRRLNEGRRACGGDPGSCLQRNFIADLLDDVFGFIPA